MRPIRSANLSHLNALIALPENIATTYDVGHALLDALKTWSTPAVDNWCTTALPSFLLAKFDFLAQWVGYIHEPLFEDLLGRIPEASVPALILKGLAAHADSLRASSVYELVALLAKYLRKGEGSAVVIPYLNRMIQRIPSADLDEIDSASVPNGTPDGVARFLWALLSDIDVRVRWRAAHAVRELAHFGESAVLASLLSLYAQKEVTAFRAQGTPFYWLTARLWLMIALDGVALESPGILLGQKNFLLMVATDQALPHVLIRAFAKNALLKLVEHSLITLTPGEVERLDEVNISKLPRQRSNRYDRQPSASEHGVLKRRFHFDPIDSQPYWFEPATRMFAFVDLNKFTDVAEKWIVDEWKAPTDEWRWDDEPRRSRYSERQWQFWHHSHGSAPTIERYRTYLEWHAMYCAVGDLLTSEPLADTEEDPYDALDQWIGRETLAWPPWWLSDLRNPKPLEERFWLAPDEISEWTGTAGDRDFLRELDLNLPGSGTIVVWASHRTKSSQFELKVAVHTALVEPKTASSLVRALQSALEPIRFGIPSEGNERVAIDKPPYRLLGWLAIGESRSGIDQRDPLRREVEGFSFRPGSSQINLLTQRVLRNSAIRWVDAEQKLAYLYEEWSDEQPERDSNYDYQVRSAGSRLHITTEQLRNYLVEAGLDLLVEVEMTRTKDPHEHRRSNSKEASQRYERIFLLRRDGSIETAEGHIGTWHSFSS